MTRRIQSDFVFQKCIGSGSFGTVRIAIEKNTGNMNKYAIKQIRKWNLGSNIRQLKREIEFLRQMDHPNIVKLFSVYEDNTYIFLVMQYWSGGELDDHMRLHGRYTEKQTAYLLKKIILAVLVLHRQGIAHRDVKPDNFIFESERIDAELKLIDLGLSQKYMKSGEKVSMSSAVGTPYYTAPEVLRGDYGPECDVWSIGIIMYTMLTGKLPFQGESSEEIKKHIRNGDIVYDPETWNALSVEARNLMMHLLEVEPGRRISLEDAISHPWFSILTDKSQSIDPQILKALRLQRYTSDIQKEAMAILVRHLATNELKELNDAFIQFDKTSTGTINANDLRKLLRTQGVDCAAEEIQQIIANTDIQGKGEINYSEFLAATLKSKQCINDEHLWQVFQRFDLDNTGVISVENVVEIFRQSGKSISQNEVTQMISEVDKVGDGNINFEEFKTFMR